MKNMGEPKIKIVAMPSHTNPAGNIFGGWILSQIDLAGAIAAREVAPERVVTISFKEAIFKEPVFIGDVVSCYAKINKIGKTSINVTVQVTVERLSEDNAILCIPVTSAEVTYVSVDRAGNKKIIDEELKKLHGF
ncbi:acyl-CoA thioesterase [Campylobacter sp. FMV-PI01]|uniref:Acyl-CoA thioesterase n=1 Tax=Campylobacter portucalensis TaxID=2608384 RepID=A0A6L5WIS6_9BACT|nr:acyl-CoA thioesterase [Campylobacter portucalensis]MSN96157.1 acyl-CoA thioesterase [Campylobacter portucalensis]